MSRSAPEFSLYLRYALSAFVIFQLAGCGDGGAPRPSSSYAIGSIYVYMQATQDESGTITALSKLREGSSATARYLYLSDGDALYANLDKPATQYLNYSGNLFSNSQTLSQNLKVMASRDRSSDYVLFLEIISGSPEYYALFPPPSGTGNPRVYFDFERPGSGFVDTSSIELPGGFNISSPVSASPHSRANSISLTWDNVDASTAMTLNMAGSCDDGNKFSMTKSLGTDTGSATVTSSDYFPAFGVNTTATCQMAFILQRVKLGSAATQFAFGSVSGIQQRTVRFVSTQ